MDLSKSHPHTRAMQMASDDMAKVIASFKRGPKFMQDPAAERRRAAIVGAPPEVQALQADGYPDDLTYRIAKLVGSGVDRGNVHR